jgi:hypothetical protein
MGLIGLNAPINRPIFPYTWDVEFFHFKKKQKMTAKELVEKLRNVQPHESCFENAGISRELIEGTMADYDLKPKNIVCSHTNELVKLVTEYDVSRLEVAGGIGFSEPLWENDRYIFFAEIESDPLVVDKMDGGIIKNLEFPYYEHIFCECALDAEHFIEVLYELMAFTSRIICGQGDVNPCVWAKKLAIISGLSSSLDFYKTVMGCWD